MNKYEITRVTIVFAILTMVGVGLAAGSTNMPDAHSQQVLVSMGSALVGGALAFFLVRMFDLNRRVSE